jgi:hypothetical protein
MAENVRVPPLFWKNYRPGVAPPKTTLRDIFVVLPLT